MKKFLAIFTGTSEKREKWMQQSEEVRNEKTNAGIAAWQTWALANQKQILQGGGPLGVTKRVDAAGISDGRNNLGAFTIIEAESQEHAARLFLNHPHFTIFPGDAVEIMEILPIPGA
jgi:hypothetical protein